MRCCSAVLSFPLEKMMEDALASSPNSTAPSLALLSAFFPVLFHSGLAGHVRIPAKYLLTQDYDLCTGFSVLIC